jgi:hypothetical protein
MLIVLQEGGAAVHGVTLALLRYLLKLAFSRLL